MSWGGILKDVAFIMDFYTFGSVQELPSNQNSRAAEAAVMFI
jgi:hypothetical protein